MILCAALRLGCISAALFIGIGILGGASSGAGATSLMIAYSVIKGGQGASWGLSGIAAMAAGGAIMGGATGAVVTHVTRDKMAGAIAGTLTGVAFAGITGYFVAKVGI